MSLINQVLQDLQQRSAPGAAVTLDALRDVRITPQRSAPRRTWLLWVLIGVLATLSAGLLWQRRQPQSPARVVASAPRAATAVAPAPIKIEHATAQPGVTPQPVVAPTAPVAAAPATAVKIAASATPANKPAPDTAPIATVKTAASAAPIAKAAVPSVPAVAKTPRPLSAEQRAELAYQDGMRLLQSGRPTAAEPQLRAALASDADHRPARAALAALLINAQHLDEARHVLAQGLELAPTYAPFAKLFARLLIDQGDLVKARSVLERAAPPVAADPDYHALLAALYQRSGLYAQAAQSYRGALQAQPDNGVWWMGLGMALEAQSDRDGALQAYRRAHDSGTLTPEVLRYVETEIAALQQ